MRTGAWGGPGAHPGKYGSGGTWGIRGGAGVRGPGGGNRPPAGGAGARGGPAGGRRPGGGGGVGGFGCSPPLRVAPRFSFYPRLAAGRPLFAGAAVPILERLPFAVPDRRTTVRPIRH